MKLLLDENLSPKQAVHLRELGHDTEVALDVGLAGCPDEDVRAYAVQHQRILLTLDATGC